MGAQFCVWPNTLAVTQADMNYITLYSFLTGGSRGALLISLVTSKRLQEMKRSCIRLYIRMRFLTDAVASHENRVLEKMVIGTSQSEFKESLDDALSDTV